MEVAYLDIDLAKNIFSFMAKTLMVGLSCNVGSGATR